jgi:type I restriction enzyme S subunit
MISQWKLVTIGDFLSHRKGFAFKSTQYTTEGRKIARVSNFTQRSIDTDGCNYIDEKEATQFSDYILNAGDVVIATVGSWPTNPASVVGRAIRVPDEANGLLLNQNAVRLRSNEHLNQKFLYYLLSADHYQNFIVSTAQGSASQASIKLKDIFSYQALIPPISEQEAIVSVVGTLDDKIENNRRMNETLEEMAQAIFKSWFVDFDPVHAKAEGRQPAHMDVETAALFPSSFGDDGLPVGWRTSRVAKVTTLLKRGLTPKYNEDGCSIVNQKCIRNGTINFNVARRHDQNFRPLGEKELQLGDILVNSTGVGTLGRVATVRSLSEPSTADTHVSIVRPNPAAVEPIIVALLLEGMAKQIADMGQGSTGQTELKPSLIGEINITFPTRSIQSLFQKAVYPIRQKVTKNLNENQTLAELRDTLLPKLMSGEIRIKDAEREVEAAV